MGLHYEMALYTELTGEDANKISIGNLGSFFRGYELGLAKGRPKGKWIEKRNEYNGATGGECSNCGNWTMYGVSYDIKANRYYFNYCPHCGADMRGEE